MPILTPHWDILKRNGLLRQDAGDGQQSRFAVLMSLLGRANIRLRCWPSVETLMEDIGLNDRSAIAGALKWLADHGAIYNVPPDKRIGRERYLLPQKYVFQLTGIIKIGDTVMEYILMQPEEREAVIDELQELGAEYAVELYGLLEPQPLPDPEEEGGVSRLSLPTRSAQPTKLVGSPYQVGRVTLRKALPIESSTNESSTKEAIGSGKNRQRGRCGEKRKGTPRLTLAVDPDESQEQPKEGRTKEGKSYLLASFLEASTGKKLTKKERERLQRPVKFLNDQGEVSCPAPEDLYADTKTGFSRFVDYRLESYKARDKNVDLKILVGDICNYTREAKNGNPGWFAWRDKHVEFTRPVDDAHVPLHQKERAQIRTNTDIPAVTFDDFEMP